MPRSGGKVFLAEGTANAKTLVQDRAQGCLRSRKKASVTGPNKQDENGSKEDRIKPCRQGSDYIHGKQPKILLLLCV